LNGTMTVRGSGTGPPSYTGHSSPAKDRSLQQGGLAPLRLPAAMALALPRLAGSIKPNFNLLFARP
jgi:hypothetical protein